MNRDVVNAANAAGFGNDHVTAHDDFFPDIRVCEDVMLRSRSRERGGKGGGESMTGHRRMEGKGGGGCSLSLIVPLSSPPNLCVERSREK